MRQYLIRRVLLIPVLIIGITLLDFVFINLTPGDPVTAITNPTEMVNLDPAAVEARKEALGLNKPIIFGILSALHPHSAIDYLLTTFAFIGVGMPSFFFALILIVFGSLRLGWFPTSGIVTPGNGSIPDRLDHMVLPLIALSINGAGSIMRYMRSGLIEVMHEDYVTTARAKGLNQSAVVMRHAVRNALLPIITVLALHIPALFSGAVIIETIFAIPGIGSTLVSAMNTKDYPVIMGGVLMTGIIVLFSSLIADIAYAFADPRIRY